MDGSVGNNTPKQYANLMPPWPKGFAPNPAGRPKGSRNKLDEQFVEALQANFQEHGEEAIEQARQRSPETYLRVIASILPKRLEVKRDGFDEFSDEQITAILYAARAALGACSEIEEGASGPEGPQPAGELQALSAATGIPSGR